MYRDEEDWITAYRERDALWMHDGNAMRPHALLTSEHHSIGFFDSRPIIADDELLRQASSDLLQKLDDTPLNIMDIDRVVGPQTGATKLADFLASTISAKRGRVCLWASPTKHTEGGVKSMRFDDLTRRVHAREHVLFDEDVIVTGGSVELTSQAVVRANAVPEPFVLALVNRSGQEAVHGKRIVALINRPLPIWTANECPLCRTGTSRAIRPKEKDGASGTNWALLNQAY